MNNGARLWKLPGEKKLGCGVEEENEEEDEEEDEDE